MAAHIVTALAQVSQEVYAEFTGEGSINWDSLQEALKSSSWAKDLNYEHWEELDEIVSNPDGLDLEFWIGDVAPFYLSEWARLGFPTTREEWIKAREAK